MRVPNMRESRSGCYTFRRRSVDGCIASSYPGSVPVHLGEVQTQSMSRPALGCCGGSVDRSIHYNGDPSLSSASVAAAAAAALAGFGASLKRELLHLPSISFDRDFTANKRHVQLTVRVAKQLHGMWMLFLFFSNFSCILVK